MSHFNKLAHPEPLARQALKHAQLIETEFFHAFLGEVFSSSLAGSCLTLQVSLHRTPCSSPSPALPRAPSAGKPLAAVFVTAACRRARGPRKGRQQHTFRTATPRHDRLLLGRILLQNQLLDRDVRAILGGEHGLLRHAELHVVEAVRHIQVAILVAQLVDAVLASQLAGSLRDLARLPRSSLMATKVLFKVGMSRAANQRLGDVEGRGKLDEVTQLLGVVRRAAVLGFKALSMYGLSKMSSMVAHSCSRMGAGVLKTGVRVRQPVGSWTSRSCGPWPGTRCP